MVTHTRVKKGVNELQVCGVFFILVCGAGTGMFWGLQCYPVLCGLFISSYYIAAILCILVGEHLHTPVSGSLTAIHIERSGRIAQRDAYVRQAHLRLPDYYLAGPPQYV